MTILALDLGTTTGWATSTRPICSGTLSLRGGRFEGGGMRFVRYRRWLDEFHSSQAITAVYLEEVRRHRGTDAAHIYGGLLAHTTAWCEQQGIPYQGLSVGQIKRHATGKGNANKAAMIAAAERRGHHPADDNEADALAILYCALDAEKNDMSRHKQA